MANSNIATMPLNVTSVSDPLQAVNDSCTTDEDTPLTVPAPGVLGNDIDPDGGFYQLVRASNAAHGSVTLNPNGSFTYTPAANYNGPDSFTYYVLDGNFKSNTATVTLRVRSEADLPAGQPDAFATNEDTPLTVAAPGVLNNDTDVEGTGIQAVKVSDPANGTLVLNADGSFTYNPNPNFNGTDSFTYRPAGSGGQGNLTTVTFTVTPVNDAPVAMDDAATTAEDTAVSIAVLGNDTDADGSPLAITSVTQGASGSVQVNGTGVVYTPGANFHGSDSFTYTISDGSGASATATVRVTVTPVNDPPTANPQGVTTAEDTAKTITQSGSDPEGAILTYTVVSGPAHGTLSGTAPNLTYTPALNYSGTDSFTFRVRDGLADSAPVAVTITVTPVNDAPVAVNDSASTKKNTAITIAVLANDQDPEGDTLQVTAVTTPARGTLTLNANGTIKYTPKNGSTGTETFTYTINDGKGRTATATVTVQVSNR